MEQGTVSAWPVSGVLWRLAMVTILVPAPNRAKANGLVGMVQGVAFALNSVVAGLAIAHLGMGWLLVSGVALIGVSWLHLLTIRIDEPEVVHAEGAIYEQVPGPHVPQQNVWFRTRRTIGDDPALHRAVLAYMSDLTIQESVLRAHGVAWAQPGLKVASLDHAMWWHRRARVDEWLLYAQESPSARGGRGLATGRIFTRDGDLVATVAQEIMVRVPDASDAAPAGEA